VAECWIVDPDAEAVDVWRFGTQPATGRYVDSLPVRLGDEVLGMMELPAVFATSAAE
jgi:hypothetical protein